MEGGKEFSLPETPDTEEKEEKQLNAHEVAARRYEAYQRASGQAEAAAAPDLKDTAPAETETPEEPQAEPEPEKQYKYKTLDEFQKGYTEAERRMHAAIAREKEALEANRKWDEFYRQQVQPQSQKQEPAGLSPDSLFEAPEKFVEQTQDFVTHQVGQTKEEILAVLAERDRQAQLRQHDQNISTAAEQCWNKKYGKMEIIKPLVDAETMRMGQQAAARFQAGVPTDEDYILRDMYTRSDAEGLLDFAVGRVLKIPQVQAMVDSMNSKKTETRKKLDTAPTVTPTGIVEPPAAYVPETKEEYMKRRRAEYKLRVG